MGESDEEDDYPASKWSSHSNLVHVNETIRAASIGDRPRYPQVWQRLIAHIRSFQVLLFWEIFAGCAVLTECMQERGWQCATLLDTLYHLDFDLLNPFFFSIVMGLIHEGRFALIHVGPPCSSFSMAVNRFSRYRMRSRAFPRGLPNLPKHRQEKVDLGNALCDVALQIAQAQERAGHY